jgi:UPF0716 family protein affecting phage T7 exclusion
VPFLLVLFEDGSRGDVFRAAAVATILPGFLDDVLVLALLLGTYTSDVLSTGQSSNLHKFRSRS